MDDKMTITQPRRKFYEAISEFEEIMGKSTTNVIQIAEDYLNDGDFVIITKTEEYALALCDTDLDNYDGKQFLDEKLLFSTFLEMEDEVDYYIHVIQTTVFGEDDAEEFLATKEQIEASKNQEEIKSVVLKRELA